LQFLLDEIQDSRHNDNLKVDPFHPISSRCNETKFDGADRPIILIAPIAARQD